MVKKKVKSKLKSSSKLKSKGRFKLLDSQNFKIGMFVGAILVVLLFVLTVSVPVMTGNAVSKSVSSCEIVNINSLDYYKMFKTFKDNLMPATGHAICGELDKACGGMYVEKSEYYYGTGWKELQAIDTYTLVKGIEECGGDMLGEIKIGHVSGVYTTTAPEGNYDVRLAEPAWGNVKMTERYVSVLCC